MASSAVESTVSTSTAWARCSLPLTKGTSATFSSGCLMPWKWQDGSSVALTKAVEVSHTAKASSLEDKKQTDLTDSGNEISNVIFVLLQRHLCSYCSTTSGVVHLLPQKREKEIPIEVGRNFSVNFICSFHCT